MLSGGLRVVCGSASHMRTHTHTHIYIVQGVGGYGQEVILESAALFPLSGGLLTYSKALWCGVDGKCLVCVKRKVTTGESDSMCLMRSVGLMVSLSVNQPRAPCNIKHMTRVQLSRSL